MEGAVRRVAGVDPGGAGPAIAPDAGAMAEVPCRAELQDGVVAAGEGEGDGGGGVGGAGRHDGGVEDGDDGSGGEFPEPPEGGGEEEEADLPLEVGEGDGHVFAPRGVGRGGGGGLAGGGCLVRLFVVAWCRFGGDDAHDDDVAVDVMGVIASEEVRDAEDLLSPERAGQEGLWEDPLGEVEGRVLVEPFSRFG